MAETLKPCPLCGGEAELVSEFDEDFRAVECARCDYQVRESALFKGDPPLVEYWNTRPVEDALVEALEAARVVCEAEGANATLKIVDAALATARTREKTG